MFFISLYGTATCSHFIITSAIKIIPLRVSLMFNVQIILEVKNNNNDNKVYLHKSFVQRNFSKHFDMEEIITVMIAGRLFQNFTPLKKVLFNFVLLAVSI